MNTSNSVTATILKTSSRALAGYAANELLRSRPSAKAAIPARSLAGWQDLLAARIGELSVAVTENRPELFSEQVRWARRVLAVQGIPGAELKAGLRALHAVVVRELPSHFAATVDPCFEAALADFDREPSGIPPMLAQDSPHGRLTAEYLIALLEGDRLRASHLILQAARQGTPITELYQQVLLPALDEIGRMWLSGEANVAEEHFATATTKMVMTQLRQYAVFGPRNHKTLIAAAVVGNYHDLGLQMVADLFEMDGWRAIQLGADMPAADLVQAISFFQADLVALSVSIASQLPTARATIEAIRRSERGAHVKILLGGGGIAHWPDLASQLGADGFAADPSGAVALGSALVGLPTDPCAAQCPNSLSSNQ